MAVKTENFKRWVRLIVLFMGGGIIFILPYLSFYFYLPLQASLGIDNTKLGLMSSVYGITTILCNFPGGWLADRFSVRKLFAFSYIATGIIGLYYSTYPSFGIVIAIQVAFGITTSLTYWSALIKATRQLGSSAEQGRFFGILEGGRNITRGAIVAIALGLFAKMGSESAGLTYAILIFSGLCILAGIVTWFIFEDTERENTSSVNWRDIGKVLRIREVWLIAITIFGAYVSSVGIMYLTPYATEVYGQTVVFGTMLALIMQWTSPFVSSFAGTLADKIGRSRTIIYCFGLLIVGMLIFALVRGNSNLFFVLVLNSLLIGIAVYSLRGLYWSLLEDGNIPRNLTGTATGVISTIAFTPDVFIPVIGGQLLDKYPGGLGYQYIFMIVAGFGMLGCISTYIFRNSVKQVEGAVAK